MQYRTVFLCMALLAAVSATAQDIWFTRTGQVVFHAGTSLEDIDGTNNEVASMLNIKTGELAFTVLVKSFHFKRALMEEHFNENYMESNQFPKASFKGRITNLQNINFTANGTYTAETEGELTIKGITRKISTPAKITVQKGGITGTATFRIVLADYGIKIPSVVADKIAKEAEITVSCPYTPRS